MLVGVVDADGGLNVSFRLLLTYASASFLHLEMLPASGGQRVRNGPSSSAFQFMCMSALCLSPHGTTAGCTQPVARFVICP